MVESIKRFDPAVAAHDDPGALHTEAPKAKNRTSLLGLEHSRAHQVLAMMLISAGYLALLGIGSPAYADRPHASLVHLIFLVGFGVVLLGLWDLLALRSLRRILSRDRTELVAWIRERGLLFEERSEDLAGGLVQAAIRRYQDLGEDSPRFLDTAIRSTLVSTRLGTGFLAYAFTAAPLLGLLGTLLGLRTTFENTELLRSGSLQLDRAMPFLGLALVTTMLGLVVTLASLLLSNLINRPVARDCNRLIEPVVEVATLRTKETAAAEDPSTDPLLGRRSCSPELRRTRFAAGGAALLSTLALVVWTAIPGGLGDTLFTRSSDTEDDSDEVTESRASEDSLRAVEPPPEPPPAVPPEDTAEVTPGEIEVSLAELLSEFQQSVEAEDAESLIFAFLRYRDEAPPDSGELGQGLLARTYGDGKPAIAGFVDLAASESGRRRLNALYPRLVARLDCVVRRGRLTVPPVVTYALLEGVTAPSVQTASYLEFREFRDEHGYPFRWGQVLDRARILDLLTPADLRRFRIRATATWTRQGRPAAGDEEHLVLWILFEPQAKLEHVEESLGSLGLEGSIGDYVAFHWAGDESGATLEGAELVSPTALDRLRKNP